MGLGQILSYATRRIKPNQIRIRKRELDASNNRSFASKFVSSEYDFTALIDMLKDQTWQLDILTTTWQLYWFPARVWLSDDDNLKEAKDTDDVEIGKIFIRQ